MYFIYLSQNFFVIIFQMDTVLHSCGIADCVASSYGGRNRKCAAKFATWLLRENESKNVNERYRGQPEVGMISGLADLSDGLIYEVTYCYHMPLPVYLRVALHMSHLYCCL